MTLFQLFIGLRHSFKLIFILALFGLLASCEEKGFNQTDEFEIVKVEYKSYIKLNENLTVLGRPSSIAFSADGFILTDSQSQQVILYDSKGNQIKVIKEAGSGPLQFQNPSIVKYHKGKFYIWCSQLLKLISYSDQGNPIAEYKVIDRAINDFVLFDNKIIAYSKGGFTDSYIHIYNLNSKELEISTGEVSNEQILLDIFACSGGIEIKNNELIFIAPDKLEIQKLDLNKYTYLEKTIITDNEFKVKKINTSPKDLVNSNFNQVIDYINENSTVTGIHQIDGGLVVVAEVGKYEGNAQTGVTNSSNRFNRYYVLNDKYELIKVFESNKLKRENPCLIAVRDDSLYMIFRGENDSEDNYELRVISF
ncbi:6-bladed beta-propeller [Algoriphagus namhaensis]